MLACCFIFIHLEVICALVPVMQDWRTNIVHSCWKRLANYTAFCLSVQKAFCSLVGIWPDVFPVVLHCRTWWQELCPMVVVLARKPLTRWQRSWNMLIKLKTTRANLHQILTLVVREATVGFICLWDTHVLMCVHGCALTSVCQMISFSGGSDPWIFVISNQHCNISVF